MEKKLPKFLQPNWEAMHSLQTNLLEECSLQERIQDWLDLQNLFRDQLDKTEPIFRPQREAYLRDLQNRLQAVGDSIRNHAKPT